MNIEIFLNDLIKYEIYTNKSLKTKEDVIEKYSFGECDTLVSLLHAYERNCQTISSIKRNFIGIKIELKFIDKDKYIIHYIYKTRNNKYCDINGEFDSIEELIKTSKLFEESQYNDIIIDTIEEDSDTLQDYPQKIKDIKLFLKSE